MPRIETVPVNDALADPVTNEPVVDESSLVESRFQEVAEWGWDVTSEVTQYGSYRRSGQGYIVPCKGEAGKVYERRIEATWPNTSIEDGFTEVTLQDSDPATARAFLVKDKELHPVTKKPNWLLLTFRAPEPTDA